MKKIYIIDDDQDIVKSFEIILGSTGYSVESQFDDIDVVAHVATHKPDLVILDVMFPQDDDAGFNIARALSQSEQTRHIPILMLSAINSRHLYVGGFSNHDRDESWLPVTEFLEKPVAPVTLLEKVKSLIGPVEDAFAQRK